MDFQKQSRLTRHSIRLQKYLADCGIGSRRACEKIISRGVVTVDAETVTQQGLKIDPFKQVIKVNGECVIPQSAVYVLLNKPTDVICTSSDEKGRRTVHDLLPDFGIRVYNVGRLDRASEGLLLMTNDGELAARLTHPKYHVDKVYLVWVDRKIAPCEIDQLKNGVTCEGDSMSMADISPVDDESGSYCYRVLLREGKNRQIRRMLAAVDNHVRRLMRIQIGSLTLGEMAPGHWRYLEQSEVEQLRNATFDLLADSQ